MHCRDRRLTRCVQRGCGGGGGEGLSRTKLHHNHTSEVHLTICGRWAARRTTKLCLPPRVYNSHKLHVAAADTACSASPSPHPRRTALNHLLHFRSAQPPAYCRPCLLLPLHPPLRLPFPAPDYKQANLPRAATATHVENFLDHPPSVRLQNGCGLVGRIDPEEGYVHMPLLPICYCYLQLQLALAMRMARQQLTMIQQNQLCIDASTNT